MGTSLVQHVFVLMLENRSFDHMLGFSGIAGTDAGTGQPTKINGLNGTEANIFNGRNFTVSPGALNPVPADPGHEFPDVLRQLCGPGAIYPRGGAYPAIDDSGFVASYAGHGGAADPGEVLNCYTPAQLPVLNALAREFTVCDNWYASMPGPTWPNRMFVHAASSGGLDHSPSTAEILGQELVDGFHFANGSIFDALQNKRITRRLYGGDDFPMVSALQGIHLDDIRHYHLFSGDLAQASFPFSYVFIEPSYDVLNDYRDGASQHPLGDVTRGEALIKSTYEAIRNSAFWRSSLLVITWDEHGGFYDHAIPPAAVAPGDTDPTSSQNQNGFTFERYGPRVPAIVISPLIPRNLIDHRLYDHSSIPATLEGLFGLNALTKRDAAANRLTALITLSAPRDDAPQALPSSAAGTPAPMSLAAAAAPAVGATQVSRPDESADAGNLPAILHAALRQDLDASPAGQRQAILARVGSIKTRGQACDYLDAVRQKIRAMPPRGV
jgi:phospholipase C